MAKVGAKKKKKTVKKSTDNRKPQQHEDDGILPPHRYGTRKNEDRKRKSREVEEEEAVDLRVRLRESKAKKNNKRKLQQRVEDEESDHDRPRAKQDKRWENDRRRRSIANDERFASSKKKNPNAPIDSRLSRGLVPVDKRRKMKKQKVNPLFRHYVDRDEEEEEEEEERASGAEIQISDDDKEEESSSNDDDEEDKDDDDDDDDDDHNIEDDQELVQGNNSRRLMTRHEDIRLTKKVTHRLAVVNMNWDHIKAVDLYLAICSCLPQGGQILSVGIYPSEFGLKCMEVEAVRGLFALLDNNEEQSEDGTQNKDEISHRKMRTYELNKLRYYYAVVVFDSSTTANHVYKTVDGTMLLRTSNVFDLRFIPDSMKFKHPPTDIATEAPTRYKRSNFYNRASQHSQVKLWEDVPCLTKKISRRKINPDQLNLRRSKRRSEGSSCSSSAPTDVYTPPSALGIIGSVPASSATSTPLDDVLPETAFEIARLESEIQEAGPSDLGEGEFVPCPSIEEILSTPLPPHAILEQQRRSTSAELAREAYQLRKHEFVSRFETAKKERQKHTDLDRPPKSGRSGNDPKTKRPPKGKRVVIKWNEASLPIGDWGKKFNNYLGCLAKRADYFNPALGWLYQPYRGLEAAWRNIQKYFVLDENPNAWDYVFTVKMPRMLAEWKSTLKKKHYFEYNKDWERFWQLDTRADALHFAALAFYWETEKSEKKSKQCSANRRQNKFNHHLGSRSIPQLEYQHKKKMRVDEIVRLAYGTFKPNYKNEAKMKENLEMVEALVRSINQASLQVQSEGESDSSALAQVIQDHCVRSVFGPAKKYKYRLKGVGARSPKRHKTRKMKQRNASASSGMSMGTGVRTGIGSRDTYQELLRRQVEHEKRTQTLKVQNQVMMNFFMELYPDKVDILHQRMAMAVGSLGDASQGALEAEVNVDLVLSEDI